MRVAVVLLVSWCGLTLVERYGEDLAWPSAAAQALAWAVLPAFVWWFAEWTQVSSPGASGGLAEESGPAETGPGQPSAVRPDGAPGEAASADSVPAEVVPPRVPPASATEPVAVPPEAEEPRPGRP